MIMVSSSSEATPQLKYHVFLSFRGKDTHNNFTSYLYLALCSKGIKTFMDDQLKKGDKISSSLSKTIEVSKISVIVFSKNYASSQWCLGELEHVLQCKRTSGQIVIPVFYHVDPADVRHQTGTFGDAFAKLQRKERFRERLEELNRWKAALKEAADLSGYHVTVDKPEPTFITEIVGYILERLNESSPSDSKDLVGVESAIEKVESLLHSQSNSVCIVGIWGIGGIGKTTIARAVYNKILSKFEASYFAESVREESEKSSTLTDLRRKLIATILQDTISNTSSPFTKERLAHRKVLIVFDGVTYFEQIEKLIGDPNYLGKGSKVIITTRDKQVFKNCGVDDDHVHEIRGLGYHSAFQLFNKYAFRLNHPSEDFKELSMKILQYAGGVPLALKVLGSYLVGKTKDVWESEIERLGKHPPQKIQEVLKISFDALNEEQRTIFLDIVFFFKGWEISDIEEILDADGISTKVGISDLIDKSLVTKSWDGIISVHDLLQEMGKEVVQQESKDPGKRNRLCNNEDICNLLRRNEKNENIRGISLDIFQINDQSLNLRSLKKMRSLRFLNVFSSKRQDLYQNLLHGPENLDLTSTKLTYFGWRDYSFNSMQLLFPEKIVRIEMPGCKAANLWNGVQNLVNLKYLNLEKSYSLLEIPNLSKALNLQELILGNCVDLLNINSSSIENLRSLVNLDLYGCYKLTSFPDFVQSEFINLRGCVSLEKVPNISRKVETLYLDYIPMRESPFVENNSRLVCMGLNISTRLERSRDAFGNLEALEELDFDGERLSSNEDSSLFLSLGLAPLRSLKRLSCYDCKITKLPKNLGRLSSLQTLDLSYNNFESIPSSIKDLCNLRLLEIVGCHNLIYLPELPRGASVNASECSSLQFISDLSFLYSDELRPQVSFVDCFELNLWEITHKEFYRINCDIYYPGKEIPQWFSIRTTGSYITLEQPPDWKSKDFLGVYMCAVLGSSREVHFYEEVYCEFQVKTKDGETKKYVSTIFESNDERMMCCKSLSSSDHVCMGFVKSTEFDYETEERLRNEKVSIKFWTEEDSFYGGPKVKECGVHFLYRQHLEEPTQGSTSCLNSASRCSVLDKEEDREEEHPNRFKFSNFIKGEPSSSSRQPCRASTKCDGKSTSFTSNYELPPLPEEFNRMITATCEPCTEDFNSRTILHSQKPYWASTSHDGKFTNYTFDYEVIPLEEEFIPKMIAMCEPSMEEFNPRMNQCSTSTVRNLIEFHRNFVGSNLDVATNGVEPSRSGCFLDEQLCWAPSTCDVQSSNFLCDDEIPQNFVKSTTKRSFIDFNGAAEPSGSENQSQSKRLRDFKFI